MEMNGIQRNFLGQVGFGLIKGFSIQWESRCMRIKKIIRAVTGLAGSYDMIHSLAGLAFP
jgi:hypothetical protein